MLISSYIGGASWVVNGAGEEDLSSAIDDEASPVVGDGAKNIWKRIQQQKQQKIFGNGCHSCFLGV